MHLFAGAGGGILADILLGHQPVCAVEINEYCQQVLSARQKDCSFPWFPIFDDVQIFDGRPWRGLVDVVAGGFPCQDISIAGKGAGLDGARSGLWSEFARIIGEVRPRYAFVENSPILVNRGLDRVLCDLAAIGMDARWGVLSASDVGAPHLRARIWILAEAMDDSGCIGLQPGRDDYRGHDRGEFGAASEYTVHVADTERSGCTAGRAGSRIETGGEILNMRPCNSGTDVAHAECQCSGAKIVSKEIDRPEAIGPASWIGGPSRWAPESGMGRDFDGMAEKLDAPWTDGWEDGTPRISTGTKNRVDRLKAIGNGQVPLCAATAWSMLTSQIKD